MVIFLLVASPLFSVIPQVYSPIIQVGPVADTWIDEDGKGPQGQTDKLEAKSKPVDNHRPLIRFDLSALIGTTINSATLRLFVYDAPSVNRLYNAHRVTESWTEQAATWAIKDGGGWAIPGGSFSPTVAASATVGTQSKVWVSWDVTALVQAWVSGAAPNYGILIKDSQESSSPDRKTVFKSREASNSNERPILEVQFTSTTSQNTVTVTQTVTSIAVVTTTAASTGTTTSAMATATTTSQTSGSSSQNTVTVTQTVTVTGPTTGSTATTGTSTGMPPPTLLPPVLGSIVLSWVNGAVDATNIHIERRVGSGQFVEIAGVPLSSTSYVDSDIAPNTTYTYRIRYHRHSDNNFSPYSAELSITTPSSLPNGLANPTGLTVVPTGPTQLSSSWTNNAPDATETHIERRTVGSNEPYVEIATVLVPGGAFADLGLTQGTGYCYRIRAHRHSDNKWSLYSSEVCAATSATSTTTTSLSTSTSSPASGSGSFTLTILLRDVSGGSLPNFPVVVDSARLSTDSLGRVLVGVGQGSHQIEVSGSNAGKIFSQWGDGLTSNPRSVNVASDVTVIATYKLTSDLTITGTPSPDQNLCFVVASSLNPPLQGQTIVVDQSTDGISWSPLSNGVTDNNGRYSFTWCPAPGTYLLRASWGGNSQYAAVQSSSTPGLTVIPELTHLAPFMFILLVAVSGFMRRKSRRAQ